MKNHSRGIIFVGDSNQGVTRKTKEENGKKRFGKAALLLCNIILVLGAVISSYIYSKNLIKQNNELQKDTFCSTVESMKQLSQNYLYTEKGFINNWAKYISHQKMTMKEALNYIKTTNTQKDRYAHIVDMDDFSAYSSNEKNKKGTVDCYQIFYKTNNSISREQINKMRRMFNSDGKELLVLGKYRIGETQQTVVSVGTRVEIKTASGKMKPYLMLRIIPVEYLQSAWIFPTQYIKAEIGIITDEGEYVIQSNSMKSRNFPEYIRGYNFQNDYNKVNELRATIRENDKGLLKYKDYRGEECYWYYSSFGKDLALDILGYLPVKEISSVNMNWSIVFIICGTLLLLIIMDGAYILSINRELNKTAEMAKHANQAKTDFLSTVSHDIRTPLNAVIGMTNIAKKHLDDRAYLKDCLDKISGAGNHLLTLINNILDISKVESGKMVLSLEKFSLKQAVEEIDTIIRPRAEEKKITFNINLHNIISDGLYADQLRLNQILLNLLTNAVKYTKAGGHVTLDISQLAISNQKDKIRLICKVEDDGIGMSKDFQTTMYNSFSREQDSRIDKIQGTGLGLTIIKQIVDLLDGNIVCKSDLGKGTKFTVFLDFETAEDVRYVPVQQEEMIGHIESEFQGMHVLIAEDNDLNWEIIETMLEEYGIICDRAENGQECIDILEKSDDGAYDLVLMDVQMPVMNGKDATRKIRKESRKYISTIPIVAMTADAFAEDIRACQEAGMDGHIAKPVNIKKVLTQLRNIKQK